jgi:predicted aspartyl protease
MGRFEVEVELANYDDIARARAGDIAPQQVRRTKISGVVDTGATKLVIPESTAKLLGVRTQGTAKVRYADGRSANRDLAPGVELTYFGRQGLFIAVIEPKRTTALIGAVVMEELDLVPDPKQHTLLPRDPDQIISEIE